MQTKDSEAKDKPERICSWMITPWWDSELPSSSIARVTWSSAAREDARKALIHHPA